MSNRTLIKSGLVVSMVPGEEPREADVLIVDGRIAEIAPGLKADAETVDADGHIVLPGFVDCHRHTWQTQLRGITHDWSLKDYIRSVRMRCGPQYQPDDMRVGNHAGMLEALNSGITTVLDFCHNLPTRDHAEAALDGTVASGIRSVFAFGLTGNYGVGEPFELDERVEFVKDLRARRFSSEDQLVRLGLNASDMLSEGRAQVEKEAAIARDLGLPMTLHALVIMLPGLRSEQFPSEVEALSQAGLCLPDMVWVHMNLSTPAECKTVVDSGAAIACTPEAEIQMGMGHPCFQRVLDAGGEPCLGIDVVSNHSGCMFGQMRLALQVERMLRNDVELAEEHAPDDIHPTSLEALRAATIGGAKAVGLDSEIGTLEVGKQADIITLDGNEPGMIPVNDAIGATVLHAHPGVVANVFVAGSPKKRDGKLVGDVANVHRALRASNERIFAEIESTGGLILQPPVDFGF